VALNFSQFFIIGSLLVAWKRYNEASLCADNRTFIGCPSYKPDLTPQLLEILNQQRHL
jgi:hypothetical protein